MLDFMIIGGDWMEIEKIRNSIEVVWRKFTFKIEGLDHTVSVNEVNEGMARYRIMNIYYTSNAELISEEYIN
jgi:hypothetical protein